MPLLVCQQTGDFSTEMYMHVNHFISIISKTDILYHINFYQQLISSRFFMMENVSDSMSWTKSEIALFTSPGSSITSDLEKDKPVL